MNAEVVVIGIICGLVASLPAVIFLLIWSM
jgi:hypothetical protein